MHANRNHYQSDVQFNTGRNSPMLIVNALIEKRLFFFRNGTLSSGLFVCVCVSV